MVCAVHEPFHRMIVAHYLSMGHAKREKHLIRPIFPNQPRNGPRGARLPPSTVAPAASR